mgnify:CR=1 FL=1
MPVFLGVNDGYNQKLNPPFSVWTAQHIIDALKALTYGLGKGRLTCFPVLSGWKFASCHAFFFNLVLPATLRNKT